MKQLYFNNGKEIPYIAIYELEHDYSLEDGYNRPSAEIIVSKTAITYTELERLLSDINNIKFFTMFGETYQYNDEKGQIQTDRYKKEYENYTVIGPIIINKDTISFKLYKNQGTAELERDEAIKAVNTLLMAIGDDEE